MTTEQINKEMDSQLYAANLTYAAQAGYNGINTNSLYSSAMWLAEQAGRRCKEAGIFPEDVKMSRGYTVRVNRVYIIKFNTNTLAFEGITRTK